MSYKRLTAEFLVQISPINEHLFYNLQSVKRLCLEGILLKIHNLTLSADFFCGEFLYHQVYILLGPSVCRSGYKIVIYIKVSCFLSYQFIMLNILIMTNNNCSITHFIRLSFYDFCVFFQIFSFYFHHASLILNIIILIVLRSDLIQVTYK